MSTEKLTWRKLKETINEIPDNLLDQTVLWWGEEKGGDVISIDILEENYVRTDYGYEPASVQEYEEGDEPYPVVREKGSAIFSIDA